MKMIKVAQVDYTDFITMLQAYLDGVQEHERLILVDGVGLSPEAYQTYREAIFEAVKGIGGKRAYEKRVQAVNEAKKRFFSEHQF